MASSRSGGAGFVVPGPREDAEAAEANAQRQAKPSKGGRRFGSAKPAVATASAGGRCAAPAAKMGHNPNFAADAARQLARVCEGVAGLSANNPAMSVATSDPPGDKLEVNFAGDGGVVGGGFAAQIVLTLLPEEQQLQIYSTESGLFEYELCEQTQKWISVKHGTDMEGMLTRDLLRVCVGCPSF
jgi:hypothetical protein